MHLFLLDILQCPACRGLLQWQIARQSGDRIQEAEARCTTCGATYPTWDGIGVFLPPDLPRNDLWEQMGSALATYVCEHPDVDRQLMQSPLQSLSPADRFFRALVLDERGDYDQAKAIAEVTLPLLYTPEYLACHETQRAWVIERVRAAEGPVVDLASGHCQLVEQMARILDHPVVATDFSIRVLRRNRRWLEHFGLYSRVSLLGMDARRMPFKDGSIPTMTTNLGLPNIDQPGELLTELRRVVSGEFLAITHFYPEDDETNLALLRELGLAPLLVRRTALEMFAAGGWRVGIANSQSGRAVPTPISHLLEGAQIDGLPLAETTLEWCVLAAR